MENVLLRIRSTSPGPAVLRTVRDICGGGLGAVRSALLGEGLEWRVRLHHNDHEELAESIRALASLDVLSIDVEDLDETPAETVSIAELLASLERWDELREQIRRHDDRRSGE